MPKKTTTRLLNNNFIKNKFNHSKINHIIYNNLPILMHSKINLLLNFLLYVFSLKKNLIFIDNSTNYNYLPINNYLLFSRSKKNLHKLVKYFNVGVIIFLNTNCKLFTIKNLLKLKLINISLNNTFFSKNVDLNLNTPNNYIYNYIIYILVIKLYLKTKN